MAVFASLAIAPAVPSVTPDLIDAVFAPAESAATVPEFSPSRQ